MRYFIIFILLISVSSQAQQNNTPTEAQTQVATKKRPSWSQGLPERKAVGAPTTSMSQFGIKPAIDETASDVTALEQPELEMAVENTTLEIELIKAPVIEMNVKPNRSALTARNARRGSFSLDELERQQRLGSGEISESKAAVNPLLADYSWKVLKTTAIDVPEGFNDNQPLELSIYINPEGKVTRVTDAGTSMPSRAFKKIEKSVRQWKFEAPADIGIDEVISKTFTVEISTEA